MTISLGELASGEGVEPTTAFWQWCGPRIRAKLRRPQLRARRGCGHGRGARSCGALLEISQAVQRAQYFDEALEVIAEQALLALDAASLSISRWERPDNVLRTLVNVGDLGPGEERWPENELYPVTDDQHVVELLQHGRPYISSIDDENVDPAAVAVLRRVNKESELAVAVMFDDTMWGELWATGAGGRRFGLDDIQLLQAIAAHVAVAIGRTELFSMVWRYAFEDPLTGLANRRKIDGVDRPRRGWSIAAGGAGV